ncbi:MAG: efflux RND transporter periplasmic adaptor subunit [Pseudomonadota bacterium]|nr:efflux RND transporter periplasmic adaptor subunit [Pseudomonadota bacterium]
MSTNSPKHASSRFRYYALGATALAGALALGIPYLSTSRANDAQTEQTTPQAASVTVAHPTVKQITEWDEFTGRFAAIDSVEVRARVSGYLEEIAFEDGQIVKKGDLLFKIDPRPFEAELDAAKADLASAEAELQNAQAENERGRRLLERAALSKEEADRRTRVLRQAEAGRAAAKARVDQAALNLEFTEVRAPITGRISDDFVSEGNLIVGGAQGGTLLTTIVSLDPIYFEFTASEADYLKYIRLASGGENAGLQGQSNPVFAKLIDESEFSHEGKLSFVDNQLDPSTGTMRGRATFDNPNGVLSPGMFGRLKIAGSGEYNALLIPDSAVQTDQNEKFVWVADANDVAQRRKVELGPVIEGGRIVRSGLNADDRIIVGGTQFVMAGAAVAPQADQAKLASVAAASSSAAAN